jgi:hypothetical protein
MKKSLIKSDVEVDVEEPLNLANRLPTAYSLELHRLIEFQAYLLAEKDGFRQDPIIYWTAAEGDIHQYF